MDEQETKFSIEKTLAGADRKTQAQNERMDCVVFQLMDRQFAIPLEHVQRVIRMAAVTPVPDSPPEIMGIINLQGNVVPVLDIRESLSMPAGEANPEDRILIAEFNQRLFAFVVDDVQEVLQLTHQQIEASREHLPASWPLVGVIQREEGLIVLLDTAQVVPKKDVQLEDMTVDCET